MPKRLPDDLNARIGANLKTLRLARGLAPWEIKTLTGIATPKLGQLEKGTVTPSLNDLLTLAPVYGVVISEITGEKRAAISPREYQLLRLYRSLNPIMRKTLIWLAMILAGEMTEKEDQKRKTARWAAPTKDRDPLAELAARNKALDRVVPPIERLFSPDELHPANAQGERPCLTSRMVSELVRNPLMEPRESTIPSSSSPPDPSRPEPTLPTRPRRTPTSSWGKL